MEKISFSLKLFLTIFMGNPSLRLSEVLDRIDAILVVKEIIVISGKNETILILISLKRYFLHPEKSIINLSLP